MTIAFILFGLLTLLYILGAKRRVPLGSAPEVEHEIAALIAEHEAQTFASDDERASQEYHLYHAIAQLRRNAGRQSRLPLWIWALAPLLLAGATWLWYVVLGGHFAERWHALERQLSAPASRSLHLGQLPQNIESQAMHAYCQILQSRTDRRDPDQLDTLGQCYAQYGNHAQAADIYRHLMRLEPQNDHAALQYAQTTLFARPDQAMASDVEAILTRLYRENPDDTLTGILLATAYTRAGDSARAQPVWAQLKARTDVNHPLYALIDSTAAQIADKAPEQTTSGISERPVTIRIPQALLERLPSGSQLFVSLAGKDNPMPLAVRKLSPQTEQRITFRADDSMTGAEYLNRDDLVLRAFISADGSVSGEKLADLRQDFHIDTHPTLEFPAP